MAPTKRTTKGKATKKVVTKRVLKKTPPKTAFYQVRAKGPQRLRAGVMFSGKAQDYALTEVQLAAVEADPELIIS